MEYEKYTQKNADKDGIEYAISKYSTKCIDNGKVIGSVVFINNRIVIDNDYIKSVNDKEAELYYNNINKSRSILLHKMSFSKSHRYSGKLEDFFDFVVNHILPKDILIWCNTSINDYSLIEQIGGFVEPLYPFSNKTIRLFSINS
jgi:hypothetical protein